MAIRNKRVRIFESSIEKLGRILSNQWKIKVVFKHGECKTNGKTIYLPVLPDNADKELMDAMQGHLDHEAAHVVFSDFNVLKRIMRTPKLFAAVNALEDLRIEEKWIGMWGGAAVNLRRSMEWAFRKVAEEREVDDPENPGQKKLMRPWDGLSDFGKVTYSVIPLAKNDFKGDHWFLQDVVEPEVLAKAKTTQDIVEKAIEAETTAEVIKLAKDFLDRLNEDNTELKELDPEEIEDDAIILPPGAVSPQDMAMHKQPDKKDGEPPVYATMPTDEEGNVQSQNPQTGDSEDMEGYQGEADGPTDYIPPDDSQPHGVDLDVTDEQLARDVQLTSRQEQLKEEACKDLNRPDQYLVYTTEEDEFEIIRDGDRQKYKKFMTEAVRMVSTVRRKMARSLLSTNETHWEGDKTRGKINPRALYRVSLGTSKRVFRQRVEAEDFDTVVLMMIDHSGSMWGYQLGLAAKTAMVFGEIFHQLGIPFGVMGFSTGNSGIASRRVQKATSEERHIYSRWGNLWIGQYKGFDDAWPRVNHRLTNMEHNTKVNTYDGESLRYGAQVLLQRPEKRKILFWMNDGEPCPNGADDWSAHTQYAKDCAKEVEKLVELFAIGIDTNAVKRFYSNYVVVNRLEDLPGVCLGELDSLLRKGKNLRAA